MERLSVRRWVRRYLAETNQIICPPMGQNGFNEWNYWHRIDAGGGCLPVTPERLILAAWDRRKAKRDR